MVSAPIQVIECCGTPRQMGRQYGEQAREAIHHNVELFSRAWHEEEYLGQMGAIRRVLERELPQVVEEIEGISEGAGIPAERILFMNHVATLGEDWLDECTALAVADGPDGPIVATNNDGGVSDQPPFGTNRGSRAMYVLRRTAPDMGLPMAQVTYSGWLSGLDAMNAAGLANMHGSVGSRFDKSGPRVDVRLWIYHLMSTCSTTREFIEGMFRGNLTGKGFSIAVGDRSGDTAIVEAAVPLVTCRDRGRQFVYSTNLYASEALRDADMRSADSKPICHYRTGYLRWIEENSPPSSLVDMQKLLSSHDPWAPCRHGGPDLSHTEWSAIALPKSNRLLVSNGPPCQAEYQQFEVG